MELREIKIGVEYAIREPPRPGVPLQRVRVIEAVRSGKWRVEWIDPNPGLVDFVKSKNVIVEWSEQEAFLRDENAISQPVTQSAGDLHGLGHPVAQAVNLVLQSTGERLCTGEHGSSPPEAETLDRLAKHSNLNAEHLPSRFEDRWGRWMFSFHDAAALAKAFAASEPHAVGLRVDVEERRYEEGARGLGNSHLLDLVEEYRASWALVRDWAGHDCQTADHHRRSDHYRRVAEEAIAEVRGLGGHDRAQRLERRLQRL